MQTLREKCAAYLRDGVRECWLIDPESRAVEQITLAGEQLLGAKETLTSPQMPGFELELAGFFALLDK